MSVGLTWRPETWSVCFQTDCGRGGADAGHEVSMGDELGVWLGREECGTLDTMFKPQGVDSPGEVALLCFLPGTLGGGVWGRPVQYQGWQRWTRQCSHVSLSSLGWPPALCTAERSTKVTAGHGGGMEQDVLQPHWEGAAEARGRQLGASFGEGSGSGR